MADNTGTLPPHTDDVVGLRFVIDPKEPNWGLHTFDHDKIHSGLLGWIMATPPIEGGVPNEVGALICRVLCRSFSLTFTYTGAPPPTDIAAVISLRSPITARWLANRPNITLAHTTSASFAQHLFDGGFSWTQQAQIVFLSPLGAPAPPVTTRQIYDLLERNKTPPDRLAKTLGINGLMFPAVDGDFAEVILWDEAQFHALQDEFKKECSALDIEWRIVTEQQFRQTQWIHAKPNPGQRYSNPDLQRS